MLPLRRRLAFRLAQAFDRAAANPAEAAYARLMTPVIKYWNCKIATPLIYEALECLGGNGYVEEGNLARHFREAPLNGIWEGSGNVMCLDVLRVLAKSPDSLESVLSSLERDLGGEGAAKTVDVIRTAGTMAQSDPGSARILTEQLALTAGAAELRRIGLGELADAFVETRLGRIVAQYLRHAGYTPECGRYHPRALSGEIGSDQDCDRHGEKCCYGLQSHNGGIKRRVPAHFTGNQIAVHGRGHAAANCQAQPVFLRAARTDSRHQDR